MSFRRFGASAAIVGSSAWIISEIIELFGNEWNIMNLIIVSVAFAGLALGYPGLHLVQKNQGGFLSLIGAVSATFGMIVFLILLIPDLIIDSEPVRSLAPSPLFMLGYFLSVGGAVFFGISALRARIYPNWTGWVLISGTAISFFMVVLSYSSISQNILHLITAIALISMAKVALSKLNDGQP